MDDFERDDQAKKVMKLSERFIEYFKENEVDPSVALPALLFSSAFCSFELFNDREKFLCDCKRTYELIEKLYKLENLRTL